MRKQSLFLIILFFSVFIYAETVRIGYVKGMNAIPFVFMFENAEKFEFSEYSNMQTLTEKMKNSEIDCACMPLNIAIFLYNENILDIACISILQNINTSFVSASTDVSGKDFDFSALSDLIGKKLCVSEKSFSYSILLWLLEKNAIPVNAGKNAIELVFMPSEQEILPKLFDKTVDAAILAEPCVSAILKLDKNFKKRIDAQDAISAILGSDSDIPCQVFVTTSDFFEKQYDSILDLLKLLEYSMSEIKKNPIRATFLAKKYNFLQNNEISANVIFSSAFCFKSARASSQNIEKYIEIYNKNPNVQKLKKPDKKFFAQ